MTITETKLTTVSDELDFEQPIHFKPGDGSKPWRKGIFLRTLMSKDKGVGALAEVRLDGDPFAVLVTRTKIAARNIKSPTETEEIHIMTATATPKLSAKELRQKARELDIEAWEDLGLADLRAKVTAAMAAEAEVVDEDEEDEDDIPVEETDEDDEYEDEGEDDEEPVDEDEDDEEDEPEPEPVKAKRASKPAAKAAATKTPAKATKSAAKPEKAAKPTPAKAAKAAPAKPTKVPLEADGPNPYAVGSNVWKIAEELLKGGKRSGMVTRLKKKIELKPRGANEDYNIDAEIDRRILITGQDLRKTFGFEVIREGRGADATIQAIAPE